MIRTVPLMFLAGFLGAVMSHLWEPGTLIGSDPSLVTMLGVAAFGIGELPATRPLTGSEIYNRDGVSIESIHLAPRSPNDLFPFTKQPAANLGITAGNSVTARNFIEPFILGRGLSAGDFNRDGWFDIAVATNKGFELFLNQNGARFHKIPLELGVLQQKNAFNLAMVDMNNDGWLDFYLTSYAGGNYLALNPLGEAAPENIIPVAGRKTLLTMSLSIGDINMDGWLDLLHGNWNGGELVPQPGESGRNELLVNKGLNFSPVTLPQAKIEMPGNSLSALLSDINQDNRIDLMVGNDFEVADQYYLNLGEEKFQPMEPGNTIIPESPLLNMSIDTGDYNNDLLPDIYMTGGAWIATEEGGEAANFKQSRFCERIENESERKECIKIWMLSRITLMQELKECDEMEEMFGLETVKECMVADRMHQFKYDRSVCEKIPSSYPE